MSVQSITSLSQSSLIVNLAPTGMVPMRQQSSYVPLQPNEIIEDVVACAAHGVTMVHLHARDEHGNPTYRKEVYQRIIAGIREQLPDLIIGVSCSGRDYSELEKRADVLTLSGDDKPDMASLTLSSLNFSKKASVNEPDMVYALAEKMLMNGILPEFELFDLGMINYAGYIIEKLNLKQPLYANLMFGNIATAQPDFLTIATMTSLLPSGMVWGMGGIGQAQLPVTAMAAVVAPGVRVGLEDNLWADSHRKILTTNDYMVKRVHDIAGAVGRSFMSSHALRKILKLKIYDSSCRYKDLA